MYKFQLIDLIPYLLMVLILTTIIWSGGNPKKKAWYCFIIMFIFAAIRYGIGYDYFGYMKLVLHQGADYSLERIEPLSRALIEVGYATHYQVFFVIGSFLTLFPVYKACIKLSINPAYSLIIYFLFPNYYLESFSIVRNAIAYSIVLYSFVLLVQKKRILSVLMIAIACCFHKSAAIGLLIYCIYYIRTGIKIQVIIYLFSFIISDMMMRLSAEFSAILPLLSGLEHYAEQARSGGGSMTYIINALCVFNFIIWGRLTKLNPINSMYLAMFNLGGCLWNIFLPVDSTIALRLSSFFQIFIIFIVPQYKYVVRPKFRQITGLCSYSFFIFLFLSYFYINVNAYLSKPERMSCIPYQTVFFHTDYSNYGY